MTLREDLKLTGNDFSNLVTATYVAIAIWVLPTGNTPLFSCFPSPIQSPLSCLPFPLFSSQFQPLSQSR